MRARLRAYVCGPTEHRAPSTELRCGVVAYESGHFRVVETSSITRLADLGFYLFDSLFTSPFYFYVYFMLPAGKMAE